MDAENGTTSADYETAPSASTEKLPGWSFVVTDRTLHWAILVTFFVFAPLVFTVLGFYRSSLVQGFSGLTLAMASLGFMTGNVSPGDNDLSSGLLTLAGILVSAGTVISVIVAIH